MATDHSGGDGKENRNITMHISVFCGASLPHSEQITEAARQLGRAIARGGHTLLYGGSNLGLMGIAPAYSLHPAPVRGENSQMKTIQ